VPVWGCRQGSHASRRERRLQDMRLQRHPETPCTGPLAAGRKNGMPCPANLRHEHVLYICLNAALPKGRRARQGMNPPPPPLSHEVLRWRRGSGHYSRLEAVRQKGGGGCLPRRQCHSEGAVWKCGGQSAVQREGVCSACRRLEMLSQVAPQAMI